MARTWLSIRVDLVSGRGQYFWPRPGRFLIARRAHTFEQLAEAINVAMARWDFSHLSEFILADGTRISHADPWFDSPEDTLELAAEKLSRLGLGDQFAYTFDFGDDWRHLCTVGPEQIDPEEVYGVVPEVPVPYWGWGTLPDQYGRDWPDDDGESPLPPDPKGADLPPILAEWCWRRDEAL